MEKKVWLLSIVTLISSTISPVLLADPHPGDLNSDGKVNLEDLTVLAANWLADGNLGLKQVYSDRNFARISTCRRSADRWRDSRLAALHSVQVVV